MTTPLERWRETTDGDPPTPTTSGHSRSVATDADWMAAEVAARLIDDRGYQRELIDALAMLRSDGAY